MTIWATQMPIISMSQRSIRCTGHPVVVELFSTLRAFQPRSVVRSISRQQNEEYGEKHNDDNHGD